MRLPFVLCLALAAWLGVPGTQEPAASPALGGFAISDMAGRRLILLGDPFLETARPPDPLSREMAAAVGSIRTAFCSGASRAIAFDSRQVADGRAEGRQSSYTFDHLGGLVFALPGGSRLAEFETCFVATDTFARSLSVVPVVPAGRTYEPNPPSACGAEVTKDIAQRRARAVVNCWTIATTAAPDGVRVVLAEFERRGNDALAAIVLIDGRIAVFEDLRGVVDRENGMSVWRVDDQGNVNVDGFWVVFAARRGGAYVLALSWRAAEGEIVKLLESKGDRFSVILRESWYQAPR